MSDLVYRVVDSFADDFVDENAIGFSDIVAVVRRALLEAAHEIEVHGISDPVVEREIADWLRNTARYIDPKRCSVTGNRL